MNLGPHADFIVGAYVVAVCIVFALVSWIMFDYQAQRRALGEMGKRGVKRRARQRK